MELHRVVVEVDPSPGSIAAVEWCAEHAAEVDEVIAVGTVGLLAEFVMSIPPSDVGRVKKNIRFMLDHERTKALRAKGVKYSTRLEEGAPWRAVMRVAEHDHADAIVVGHHNGGIRGHFGTNDIRQLVLHSTVPVIVIPDPGHHPVGQDDVRGGKSADVRSSMQVNS